MTDIQKLMEKVVKEGAKTADEIQKRMNEKKEKTHGLLSDYGALYAVAKELGIDLSEGDNPHTKISDLKPSNSVNIVGRIKTVFGEREFTRRDGSKGGYASAFITDSSGEVRVVFWDSNTQAISKAGVGDVLKLKNGYAKENRGMLEVHAGSLASISINPSDAPSDLPEIRQSIDSIGALDAGLSSVNVICRVSNHFPKTEFTRSDGSTGSRASFIGEDESGKARVVLWDPLSEFDIKEGDIVKIENAYTREGLDSNIEVQAGSNSRISKSDKKLKLPPLPKKNTGTVDICDIKSQMNGFTVEARVLRLYEPREYSRGSMASMVLGDSTGTIRCVLWNEQSHMAEKIEEGDAIRISNAYSKSNMNNEFEVHAGKYAKIEVDKDIKVPSSETINEEMAEAKSIVDLDSSDRYVKISGKIAALEERPLFYMTCSECKKKVQNLGGEWMCEECGVVDAQPNMICSIVVEDDSGNIRAVAFREMAEKIIGMDTDTAMNLIGETQQENAPIEKAKKDMIGKNVVLMGKVNYNDYSDQLEFLIGEMA